MFRTAKRRRLAGTAGVAGGVGWILLALATFAFGANALPPSYGAVEALTPVALLSMFAGLLGYRAETWRSWGRLAAAGFVVLVVGLAGSVAGAATDLLSGSLVGWDLFVASHLLALVGASAFGAGLLRSGAGPRSGAALLAGALPVGLPASFALAAAVGDETVVALGPAASLGAGVAVLGWSVRNRAVASAEGEGATQTLNS